MTLPYLSKEATILRRVETVRSFFGNSLAVAFKV